MLSLRAGLRLCLVPLPAAEVTDKETAFCEKQGGVEEHADIPAYFRRPTVQRMEERNHISCLAEPEGSWWALLCTLYPSTVTAPGLRTRAQIRPFTVRLDATQRPSPRSNRPGIHLVCVCQTSHCLRAEPIEGGWRMFLVAAAPERTAWPKDIDIPADRGVGR